MTTPAIQFKGVSCHLVELFDCLRGGRGRFGFITRARRSWLRCSPRTRISFLLYDELSALSRDQKKIVEEGRFDYVESWCCGSLQEFRNLWKQVVPWKHFLRSPGHSESGFYRHARARMAGRINEENMVNWMSFGQIEAFCRRRDSAAGMDFPLGGNFLRSEYSPESRGSASNTVRKVEKPYSVPIGRSVGRSSTGYTGR